jgi:hypothetical protein
MWRKVAAAGDTSNWPHPEGLRTIVLEGMEMNRYFAIVAIALNRTPRHALERLRE